MVWSWSTAIIAAGAVVMSVRIRRLQKPTVAVKIICRQKSDAAEIIRKLADRARELKCSISTKVQLDDEADGVLVFVGRDQRYACRIQGGAFLILPSVIDRLLQCECSQHPADVGETMKAIHEASFATIMYLHPKSELADCMMPFEAQRIEDRRARAELYLHDVADARGEPLQSGPLVYETVARGALAHHDGDASFLSQLISREFLISCDVQNAAQLARFLRDHQKVFSGALQTVGGSNTLESVFGVDAHVFCALDCAADSLALLHEIFAALADAYGGWSYVAVRQFIVDAFSHDRSEVVSHASRIFAALNTSRSGDITMEELCQWVARKRYAHNITTALPDKSLVSALMSLRLPYVMFLDKRLLWPHITCRLRSLSEQDEG